MMARHVARAGLLASLALCGGTAASHAEQAVFVPPTKIEPLIGAPQARTRAAAPQVRAFVPQTAPLASRPNALPAQAVTLPQPALAPSPQAKLQAAAAQPAGRSSERECLARAMFFESEKTAEDGMLAVGTVVANRLRSGRYGSSICGVVGQRGQFAPGVLSRTMSGQAAERARQMADAVIKGRRHPSAGQAMFFHVANMRFKYPNMHYVLVSGGNAFYEKRRDAVPFSSMTKAIAAAKRDEALAQPIVQAALSGAPLAAGGEMKLAQAPVMRLAEAAPVPTPPARGPVAQTPLAYGGGEAPRPGTALAAVAAIKPKSQGPRVVAPSAPVLAAAGPVHAVVASVYPRDFAPEANELVASAWAPYW